MIDFGGACKYLQMENTPLWDDHQAHASYVQLVEAMHRTRKAYSEGEVPLTKKGAYRGTQESPWSRQQPLPVSR